MPARSLRFCERMTPQIEFVLTVPEPSDASLGRSPAAGGGSVRMKQDPCLRLRQVLRRAW